MVWGLVEPSGLGDYFPDGEYVGWRERLKHYFEEKMTEEQRSAYDNNVLDFKISINNKFTYDNGPVAPHERPLAFKIDRKPKELASWIELNDRLYCVDETMKQIIENLEPGLHQFWPIQIIMPNGEDYPTPYFGLVIRRFINSCIRELSEVDASKESAIFFSLGSTKKHYANITISQEAIGGAHLWRECLLKGRTFSFQTFCRQKSPVRVYEFPNFIG